MKKIFTIFAVSLLLCMSLVVAQGQNSYSTEMDSSGSNKQLLQQYQYKFENKYNFSCQSECDYAEGATNQVLLQIKTQKRFLFWNVNSEENYVLNSEGEIVMARYNFWSSLLNSKGRLI